MCDPRRMSHVPPLSIQRVFETNLSGLEWHCGHWAAQPALKRERNRFGYTLCHSNPTVEPLGTRHPGQISSSERVACTCVLRPPCTAPLQYVRGMHLVTARVCFLLVRACFDDAQLDVSRRRMCPTCDASIWHCLRARHAADTRRPRPALLECTCSMYLATGCV